MSLIFNFHNLYAKYPETSIGELESRLEREKEETTIIKKRYDTFECDCKADTVPISVNEDKKGRLFLEFLDIHMNDFCDTCNNSLSSFIGAGKSDAEQLHPRLLTIMNNHSVDLLEMAIYAKKTNIPELSNKELYQKIEDSSIYSRYLRTAESRFDWQEEPTPPGLRDEVYASDKEMDALEFEKRARIARGTLSSS